MASMDTKTSQPASGVEAKEVDRMARIAALSEEFHTSMASPKLFTVSEQARYENTIYRLLGAKDRTDKDRVIEALVYICIVNGAGPNTDWKDIKLVPGGGCKSVMMSEVVDNVVGRKSFRKFMNMYGSRANDFIEASSDVRNILTERAVRSGVPVTQLSAVVDFGVMGVDNPESLGYRNMAKTAAVQRANRVEQNSLTTKAKETKADSFDVQRGKMSGNGSQADRYGPYS